MKQYKTFLIYGFSIFFNAGISFITFSLLTHYLNEVDYGIISLYNSSIAFLSPFIAIGVQYTLGVDYFKLDERTYAQQFTDALIIPVFVSVLFTVLFVLLGERAQKLTNTTLLFTLLIPFICLLTILNDTLLSLFRNKEKHFLYAGFNIFKNLTEVSLTILLVVFLGYNWEGRLISFSATLLLVFFVIIYFIKKWNLYTGSIKKKNVGKILLNGFPFVPERLAIFVLGYSDRFFINFYESTADVGFYSAGSQVALIIFLTISALNNTFYPSIFRYLSLDRPDYLNLRKVTSSFIGLSFLVTSIVLISIPFIFENFIGAAFQKGQYYAVFLAIGSFFWAIYNVFIAFMLSLKKNSLIMAISICGMLISITSNFFSINYFGTIGAAYTSIVVYFFMAVAAIFAVHKYVGLGELFYAKKSNLSVKRTSVNIK